MNVKDIAPSAGLHGHVYVGKPVYIDPKHLEHDEHGRKANKVDVERIKKGKVVEFSYGTSD